ncbi:MAG: hypothetical protein LBC48_05580 [Dysgonamonadaceae bacterium]|jgi:hypothetical protein|nr:hypothetical protein [Dysgonamonadaceae bacterium]
MKIRLILTAITCLAACPVATFAQSSRIVANPMNLNYRFQPDEPSRREAADPVIEYFKGKYYLFASNLTLGDTLFYLASGSPQIHYTLNPDADNWNVLSLSQFEYSETDFAFFKDEITGKVYVYWGCSDSAFSDKAQASVRRKSPACR